MDTNKTVSYSTWIIGIIIAAVIAVVIYSNINRSQNAEPEQITILEQHDREIGDNISLTGTMESDGDLRFYTHTIQTENYGTIGLRSRENLNAYKWPVAVQWEIERVIEDIQLVVVNVSNVTLLPDATETDEEDQEETNAQYIRRAGIYFPTSFFDLYGEPNTLTPGTITITQWEDQYNIQYFLCTQDETDTDCGYLASSFTETASKVFTTADGMTFYKMSEADSWFSHNEELFGYFFNDISEQNLLALTRQIDFPTLKSVEQRVLPNIANLCNDGSTRMWSADQYALMIQSSVLHLAITWSVGTQEASCELVIDYAQKDNALMTQFVVQEGENDEEEDDKEPEEIEEEPTEPVIRPTPFDTSVEQFSISLENPFVFTSSRGHTLTFPSQNIAFAPAEFDNNPVISSAWCYAQQHMVSYANKPQLETQPSIIIYECRSALEADTLPEQYISYPLEEGKNFIVYVIDGSRRDFANNIVVSSVE